MFYVITNSSHLDKAFFSWPASLYISLKKKRRSKSKIIKDDLDTGMVWSVESHCIAILSRLQRS